MADDLNDVRLALHAITIKLDQLADQLAPAVRLAQLTAATLDSLPDLLDDLARDVDSGPLGVMGLSAPLHQLADATRERRRTLAGTLAGD